MEYQLLLDTCTIIDLVDTEQQKGYINYEAIKNSQINISTLNIFELIENHKDFNKNEKEFRENFKKVKGITKHIITNFEIDIDDEKLLNMDQCSSQELELIRNLLFDKIKESLIVFYDTIILSFIIFQLKGIVNEPNCSKKDKKNLNYKINMFGKWLDELVKNQTKDLKTKNQIHNFFKSFTNRVCNLATHIFISLEKYNAIGPKYGCKYLRKLQRFITLNYTIDKDYHFFKKLIVFIKNNFTEVSEDKIKDIIVKEILKGIKFKYKDSTESINKNDHIYLYIQDWIEHRLGITKHDIRIENDMIDFLISDIRYKYDRKVELLPISSDTRFIKICCNDDRFKNYYYFDKLKENKDETKV